jgi:hypothetical protein
LFNEIQWRNDIVDICTVQKIRWPGKIMVIKKNYMVLYGGHKSDKLELGTGFYISRYSMDN